MACVIVVMRGCVGIVCKVQGGYVAESIELNGMHMCGCPLVECGIAHQLAKSAAFVIASFGYCMLMFVCPVLACGASGDAVESIAWLGGDLFALSMGVEVYGTLYDLGDGLTHEVLENLVEM